MKINPERIKEARLPNTQDWLAREINRRTDGAITSQTVSNWERGVCEPSTRYFLAMCDATGKSASFFYGENVGEFLTNSDNAA